MAAMIGCAVLSSSQANAQWWSRGPSDFEECADVAEKAASREAKRTALSECNAKFAGRRKPGGGYTYFDFMQNRSFDIAGPNPSNMPSISKISGVETSRRPLPRNSSNCSSRPR